RWRRSRPTSRPAAARGSPPSKRCARSSAETAVESRAIGACTMLRSLVPIGFVVAVLTIGLTAQTPAPPVTAAQADAGRAAYEINCSGCHLRDLQGQFEAPQLSGSNFLGQWGDKPAAELQTYLMSAMPPTSPGAPGPQAMTAILAYILQANG